MHSQIDVGSDDPDRADSAAEPGRDTTVRADLDGDAATGSGSGRGAPIRAEPARPSPAQVALQRRLADSRRGVDICLLLLLAAVLVFAMLVAGQPTWTFGAAVAGGLVVVLAAFAAFLVSNGADFRLRRDLVPQRLELAAAGEPVPAELRALPWRSPRAMIGFFLPLVYVGTLIWRLRVEQAHLDTVLPGDRVGWRDLLAWALLFGLILLVPAVILLLVYRRYQPGSGRVLARVDAGGIWLRAMRVTVPWTEIVSIGLRLDDRPETGLLVEVADPEAIVARSAYRGLRRRYALWTLRGGDRNLMIDEFWLAEPVDAALAAARAYHRETWADTDADGAEPVQRAELTGWVF
ncbi:hypothetical protein QEZ54_01195 [Catellatospora sp. KI3]|uniref:hypothetical protein n=1 Tax=Catellatospora sp. KI3 TaxID=3041620 RepID=UPI0024826BEE|nr:hypothetical protein [Catellatospora sp. KI3]MDI1459572.1 hypothetical protein [Catellatospora sp. KI3]